ncbi:PHD finger protein 13 [Acanthosepion pharaonis]|uniref:PHD finger protein 13 n=1 Tax=Acanthosepion pharaonis TaxID=158019 RepID=A0A812EGB6_ACAPH|nr:PHD finger protein 13 [Sepia pharaonis]
MLLQRTNPQSVETFPIMPRNAFKAPKTKRSPAKQETELYASSSKKRRTKDDFYTFCTIVLSYTQYESLKREELRQQNNISPVGSGGSAADSYSSDSTASLSSSSLQECLQDSLQDGLPVDRVQQPTQDTTPTAISSSSNPLNERVTTPHQSPKQQQQQFLKQQQAPKHQLQTVKPSQQPLQQSKQPQQPNLKQSPLSKNPLSVYDVKHKQPKQQQPKQSQPQQQPKQSQPQQQQQQTSPKHQQPQIKQEPSAPTQPTPLTVTPTSTSMTQSHHQNTTNRVESKISPKVIKLEPSTYSPQEQNSHQEQLPEDKKPNRFELLQRPKQEENFSAGGKQKIHIKKEVVEDEEVLKDKENEISKVSPQERRVNAVRKANLRYSKLEVNTSHENAESNTDSCADSIHSNCSSSPDVNETDEESWDLITCHCLKPYAGRPMIECSECSTWIHLSCAKIRKSNIPETFVCQQCREAKFTTRKSNRIRTESKRISI